LKKVILTYRTHKDQIGQDTKENGRNQYTPKLFKPEWWKGKTHSQPQTHHANATKQYCQGGKGTGGIVNAPQRRLFARNFKGKTIISLIGPTPKANTVRLKYNGT
jgi:hypothetical protein